MTLSAKLLVAAGAGVLLVAAGCGGSSAVVSGQVTYDGQPVENGAITFQPADGRGPSTGAQITGGRYQVRDVPPGPKIAQIEGFRDVPGALTSDDLAQQAEEALRRGIAAVPPAEYNAGIIPADAEGNNTTVDIQRGRQAIDFHLKPPVRGQ